MCIPKITYCLYKLSCIQNIQNCWYRMLCLSGKLNATGPGLKDSYHTWLALPSLIPALAIALLVLDGWRIILQFGIFLCRRWAEGLIRQSPDAINVWNAELYTKTVTRTEFTQYLCVCVCVCVGVQFSLLLISASMTSNGAATHWQYALS